MSSEWPSAFCSPGTASMRCLYSSRPGANSHGQATPARGAASPPHGDVHPTCAACSEHLLPHVQNSRSKPWLIDWKAPCRQQAPGQASSGRLPVPACMMDVAVAHCQRFCFLAGSGSSADVNRGQQRPPAPTQSEEELIQRAREQIEEQMQQRYKEFDQVRGAGWVCLEDLCPH